MIPSKCRNPVIADIFNCLHYMEGRGSDFKIICGDYENQIVYTQEKAPKFNLDHDSFILTLKKLNYKKSADKKETVRNTVKSMIQMQKVFFFMQKASCIL